MTAPPVFKVDQDRRRAAGRTLVWRSDKGSTVRRRPQTADTGATRELPAPAVDVKSHFMPPCTITFHSCLFTPNEPGGVNMTRQSMARHSGASADAPTPSAATGATAPEPPACDSGASEHATACRSGGGKDHADPECAFPRGEAGDALPQNSALGNRCQPCAMQIQSALPGPNLCQRPNQTRPARRGGGSNKVLFAWRAEKPWSLWARKILYG
jgi:hypothetical protein